MGYRPTPFLMPFSLPSDTFLRVFPFCLELAGIVWCEGRFNLFIYGHEWRKASGR